MPVILQWDTSITGGSYDEYRDGGFDEAKLELNEDDPPTRFYVGPMNYLIWSEIKADLMRAETEGEVPFATMIKAVRHGLKYWENLKIDGQDTSCILSQGTKDERKTTVSEESMEVLCDLPGGPAAEVLGMAVIMHASLTEEQRKNS